MKNKLEKLKDVFKKVDKKTMNILKSSKFKPSDDNWLMTKEERLELYKRVLAKKSYKHRKLPNEEIEKLKER